METSSIANKKIKEHYIKLSLLLFYNTRNKKKFRVAFSFEKIQCLY